MVNPRQHVLILGAGRSGFASAKLLCAQGVTVAVLDEQWTPENLVRFADEQIPTLHHLPEDFPFDLVVTSPSFALEHPWIRETQARKVKLISELELGGYYWRGRIIAITGSKGKSSVVRCLTNALNRAGHPAVTAGNYGIPLCERVLECPNNGVGVIAVTEVSSFQMEHSPTFAPHLAALLNLQADHLDRHGSMETYTALKLSLLRPSPNLECTFVPDTLTYPNAETFGSTANATWRYTDHHVNAIPISGYFNNPVLGNTSALIVAILTHCHLTPEAITQGFETFEPLPHRMQQLGSWHGITFINDSKATSLTATQAALKIVGNHVRLIAGGLLKETDLTFLADTLRQTTRKVYLIGSAQQALYDAWSTIVPCECCTTMASAVARALSEATPGDTLLLSPGTASFDQYNGMAARGKDFQCQIETFINAPSHPENQP